MELEQFAMMAAGADAWGKVVYAPELIRSWRERLRLVYMLAVFGRDYYGMHHKMVGFLAWSISW